MYKYIQYMRHDMHKDNLGMDYLSFHYVVAIMHMKYFIYFFFASYSRLIIYKIHGHRWYTNKE